MFWTDVDDRLPGSVERANMDGTSRQVLADNVGWANGITLDYTRRKIIWIGKGLFVVLITSLWQVLECILHLDW